MFMEKECGQIKITETDGGYRIDISGKNLKEMFSGCCVKVCCADEGNKGDCCQPEKEKK
jgi:hypothetical protein